MKVALVYDRINKLGGAERVLEALHDIWPQAPLYTGVYHAKKAAWASKFTIHPSPVQHIPFARSHHEWFAWAMPWAFETFNFDKYDVVISITSAEAKGIITKPHTLHLSYLLTPTRYLWSHTHFYQQGNYATNKNFLTRRTTPAVFSALRQWDYVAAQRPDKIIAISKTVSRRVEKYYRRPVDKIIYPPLPTINTQVDTLEKPPSRYYLLVSRLVPYKRIDLAIKAFNQLGHRLIIIGDGAQRKYLKSIASDNITFLGRVGEGKLARYYQKCQALIFPAEEDLGIVSLEAQSFGKPVIAYNKGGAAETVIHRKTGILFPHQSVDAIIKAVVSFKQTDFDAAVCQANANRFSIVKFRSDFKDTVEKYWQEHNKQN